jgi:hypothetical protein
MRQRQVITQVNSDDEEEEEHPHEGQFLLSMSKFRTVSIEYESKLLLSRSNRL